MATQERIFKKVNGIEIEHYANDEWVSLPYYPAYKIQEYLNKGFEKCSNTDLYKRTIYKPMYSSQCPNKKYIGDEPRDCNFSIHQPQTYTKYYLVTRSDYESMAVKPELTNVCRPSRFHNFDGFVEPIQEELKGKGWVEYNVVNYHTTYRYVMIICEN